ncbi:MAG: autotransporter outer membrane beta-barrel domain-containing protein, partial [Shewanella sp.]
MTTPLYSRVSIKTSLVCIGLGLMSLSYSAVAAESRQQAQYKPFKLSVSQISTQSANVANGETELQRDSLLLNAGVTMPLSKQWSVGMRLGYDRLDYDWRNIRLTGANNTAALFSDAGDTW